MAAMGMAALGDATIPEPPDGTTSRPEINPRRAETSKTRMSGQSSIDTAVKRLAMALDALDAAVERRRAGDRNEDTLAAQVQTMGLDRARLAATLDGETARTRKLETTNREIAERLDAAIAGIQSVIEGSE